MPYNYISLLVHGMCARESYSLSFYTSRVKIRIKEMEITKFGNNGLVCLPLYAREFICECVVSGAASQNFSCLFYSHIRRV
jgi:hypothetical protein